MDIGYSLLAESYILEYKKQLLDNSILELEQCINSNTNYVLETTNRDVISNFSKIIKTVKSEVKFARDCVKNNDISAAKKHYTYAIDALNNFDNEIKNISDFSKSSIFYAMIVSFLLSLTKSITNNFIIGKVKKEMKNKLDRDISNIDRGGYLTKPEIKFYTTNAKTFIIPGIAKINAGEKKYKVGMSYTDKVSDYTSKTLADLQAKEVALKTKSKLDDYMTKDSILKSALLIKNGISLYKGVKKSVDMANLDAVSGLPKNNNMIVKKIRSYIYDIRKFLVKEMHKLD